MTLQEMLAGAVCQDDADDVNGKFTGSQEARAARVADALIAYNAPNTFKPGDIIEWKPGLRNRRFPQYGEPFVVVEVLTIPIIDEAAESSGPYWKEPLDLRIGLVGPSGDFSMYYMDSHRVRHHIPTSITSPTH